MYDWLTTELVVGTLLATSFVTVGLLALWAATSRWHWFIRAGLLFSALSPLLLVPAYEPLLMFALQAATIVAGVKLWQWAAKSDRLRPALHFSLKSLLLVTPLVAVVTALGTHIGVHIVPQNFESCTTILLNGVASGTAVLLAAWMIVSSKKRIAWPIAGVICLGLAAALAWFDWFYPSLALPLDIGWPPDPAVVRGAIGAVPPHPQLAWLLILPAVVLLILFFLALHIMAFAPAAAHSVKTEHRGRSSSRIVDGAVVLLFALYAAIPVAILWMLLHPLPVPSFPPVSPNGFDQLTAASQAFNTSPILSTRVTANSTTQLDAEVARFAPAYAQIRVGMSQGMRARPWPQDGDRFTAFKWSQDPIQGITRAAARAMTVESELAQQQQRHADAVRIAFEIIQLGRATAREGTVVDYLVGVCAFEGIAFSCLYPSVAHLDAEQCRAAIAALVDVGHDREPLEQVFMRDRIWAHHALGWHGHLWQIIDDIAPHTDMPGVLRQVDTRNQAIKRLLMTELALRGFRLRHGRFPDSLNDLTTEWLEKLPVDPFDPAGGPLRYVRNGDSFLLYSVGNDGQDNQGRAAGRYPGIQFDDQDLRLDRYFAPPVIPATNTNNAGKTAAPTGTEPSAADASDKVEKSNQK